MMNPEMTNDNSVIEEVKLKWLIIIQLNKIQKT